MTTIKKFEGKLRDSKYPEHVVNGITAILATVPFAGGIASLISDYIPSQRELRLQEFTESIAVVIYICQAATIINSQNKATIYAG